MSSAVAGALSRGHKGLTASKETRAATRKEIRGAVCISLVVQSAEALLLMRRFELCWSAGRLGGAPETFYGSTLDGHGTFYSLAIYQQNELFFLHPLKLDSQEGKRAAPGRSLFLRASVILQSSSFLPEPLRR